MGGISPIVSQGIGIASALTGGALPGLGTVSQILNAYNVVTDQSGKQIEAEQGLALSQLQAQQALQQKQLQAQIALDKQKIATDAALGDEERRQALRRAVAKQRAAFGSQGVSGGASSEAVLLGLFEESDDERKKRESLDSLKTAALDQQISQNQSLNLLQQQQLREKQKLERLYS